MLADVQQWDVWPKLCQACGYQHNGDRLSSPLAINITLLSLQTNLSVKESCVCVCQACGRGCSVCANRKIELNLQLEAWFFFDPLCREVGPGPLKLSVELCKAACVWEGRPSWRGDYQRCRSGRTWWRWWHILAGEVMSDSQGSPKTPLTPGSIIWPTCGSDLMLDYCLSQLLYTLFVFFRHLCSVFCAMCFIGLLFFCSFNGFYDSLYIILKGFEG